MRLAIVIVIIMLFISCGNDNTISPDLSDSGVVQIILSESNLNKAEPDTKTVAKITAIDQCEVRILNSTNKILSSELLTLSNGRFSGTLTVKAQNDLKVVCIGRNKDIVERVGVDEDVDVVAGETTSAIIIGWNLSYTPQITDIPATSDDGKYIINLLTKERLNR